MYTLYLVSTPIGNLGDITFRAIKTLWMADYILSEDTREMQKLLKHYQKYKKDNSPQLLSYNDHNREQRIPQVLDFLVRGKDVVLTSDRGTPLVADPGYKLVQKVIEVQSTHPQIKIDTIPGANSVLSALQLSGLTPDKFQFVGFFPANKSKLRRALQVLPKMTVIAFESPHRILNTLREIKKICGDKTKLAICRELTKTHQEVFRGNVTNTLKHFNKKKPKGEITLVINTQ